MASRPNAKNRRPSKPFLRLPRDIVDSVEYAELSAIAVKLMIDLHAQYRGNNNGDFTIAWRVIEKRGWKSKDTLYRAVGELQDFGFVIVTRRGGRRIPTLYGLTYLPIDACGGKLDVRASNTASNTWKKNSLARYPYQAGPTAVPKRQAQ
jgi:hypothetical protein